MKTEDEGRITEQEMTPYSEYDKGFNAGIDLALTLKRAGLSDEEINKQFKK